MLYILNELTGGKLCVPVRAVNCLNVSIGSGPSKKKTSMIPDSDIKCASTWGFFSAPETKLMIRSTNLLSELE